jgi:EAL domain-containing protein (putative c-di-GMP-specific phosphodiesterase class I)
MMGRLKRLGCRFALDDFGVGFASFGYLRSLPADYVKLCQTSLHGMESDAATRALVHAVASVARALGKETVAEGVETPEAARLLQELGVGCGQGYLWDWPRPEWPVTPA